MHPFTGVSIIFFESLEPLPRSAIHGVGKVTAAALTKAGLRTIGDLQDYRGELRALVGSYAPILRRYAVGEDDRALEYDGEVKSVSAEETCTISPETSSPGVQSAFISGAIAFQRVILASTGI
jgi:nucleotidyltransferase/DNA polymerase involved in DNA repair